MDTRDSNDQTLGPKHKTHVEDMHEDTSIEKKQKLLDMEAKTLGKLMTDNLGSAVAAWQHRQAQ